MSIATRPLRRKNWLAVGLVVSLALNAFIIGALATDFLRVKWHSGDRDLRAFRFELRWLENRLTPQAVDRVEAGIAEARPSVAEYFSRLRDQRAELGVLAAAPEPDRAAIDRQLATIRKEVAALQ